MLISFRARARVEWDQSCNVEQMRREMVDSVRKVCGSLRVGGNSQNNVWLNDIVKAAVERKEAPRK